MSDTALLGNSLIEADFYTNHKGKVVTVELCGSRTITGKIVKSDENALLVMCKNDNGWDIDFMVFKSLVSCIYSVRESDG